MCRFAEIGLPPQPVSVRRAREWARERLSAWELEDAADDLGLVVSELMSNAVMHAHTPAQLTLTVGDGVIEAAVSDRNAAVPAVPPVSAKGDAAGGRGLMLVDALATQWGVATEPEGKRVWFRTAVPIGSRYADRCACACG
jgi:anti-sigma regulatory factor (Ser/Thr protein kinase)